MIVGCFNSPLSINDRTSKQKIKNIEDLSNTVNKFDLIDNCRLLPTIASEDKFFSSIHRIFLRQTLLWDIKQVLIKLKGLISYKCFLNTMILTWKSVTEICLEKFPNNQKLNNNL